MIVCPSCGSSRIRSDYKAAPLLLRAVGIRALLCDHCNHQFRSFSLRAPKSRAPRHVQQKADVFNPAPPVNIREISRPDQRSSQAGERQPLKFSLKQSIPPGQRQPTVAGELLNQEQVDLRTRITKLHEVKANELESWDAISSRKLIESAAACPECGSQDIQRRRRNSLERAVFSVTDHKAYNCESCGASFYARDAKDGDDNFEQPMMRSADAR